MSLDFNYFNSKFAESFERKLEGDNNELKVGTFQSDLGSISCKFCPILGPYVQFLIGIFGLTEPHMWMKIFNEIKETLQLVMTIRTEIQ